MGVEAAVAVGLDQLVGEPPARWHPVAGFGTFMQRVEQHTYADRRSAGVVHLIVGVGTAASAGLVMRRLFGSRVATVIAATCCVAGRMLDDEASKVGERLLADDLPGARRQVQMLVGRSTDELDKHGVSRAVIETVAENCVDAVTSSVLWATIGGAPGVLVHRAVNTLDAMVGHRNERYQNFGWASARLDDVISYLPARLTALAVACVRPLSAGSIWRTVRRDAPLHPSPNGGVIESAFAAALGVQLGGVNRYGAVEEDRGVLGDGRTCVGADIAAATRLRRHTAAAFSAGAAMASWLVRRACSQSASGRS